MGNDENVTLRLRLLDEFSNTSAKMLAELRKIEGGSSTASAKMSAGMGAANKSAVATAGGVSGLSKKLAELDSIGVPGVGRLAGAFESAGAAQATFLGGAGLAVAGIAAVGAAAFAFGVAAVNAASEAEQSEVRLASALKATGKYTDEAVEGVNDWAAGLLLAKGTSDELSASLVGQGATMGLTIEQSKRLISAAADMESITGSVAGGFDTMARAASGDERAIKTLGKQFGIITTEATTFEEVLGKIEEKTNGNAAAKVATFAGSWKLLKDQIGNMLEVAGKPLLTWATSWLEAVNTLIKKHETLQSAMALDVGKAKYLELARAAAEAWKALDWRKGQGYDTTELQAQYDKIIAQLRTIQREGKLVEGEKKAQFVKPRDVEAEAKAAEKAADARIKAAKTEAERVLEYKKSIVGGTRAMHEKMAAAVLGVERDLGKQVLAILAKQAAEAQRLDANRLAAIKSQKEMHESNLTVALGTYDVLKKRHAELTSEMEENWKRYADSIKAADAAIRSIGDMQHENQKRTMDDELQLIHDLVKAQKMLAAAEKLTGDARIEALAEYAKYRNSLVGEVTNSGLKEYNKRYGDTGDLERMSLEKSIAERDNALVNVQSQIQALQGALVAAQAAAATADQQKLDALKSEMDEVAKTVKLIEGAITALDELLGKERTMLINTESAKTALEALENDVNRKFPVTGLKTKLDIETAPAKRKLDELTAAADRLITKIGGIGQVLAIGENDYQRQGTKNANPQGPGQGHEDVRGRGGNRNDVRGGGGVVINVTTTGRTAKDIDKDLAGLWSRGSSRLRKAVAA